jgi:hypothetical protein
VFYYQCENDPEERFDLSYFGLFQSTTSFSITVENKENLNFYFFYDITEGASSSAVK